MVFATLLPLGVLQLYHSVNDGYFEARSLELHHQARQRRARVAAAARRRDLIVGGVLPFIWIAWTALRNFRSGSTVDELPESPLYTQAQPETGAAVPAKD